MSITFNKVNYFYQMNSPFQHQALHDINLEIKDHSFTAIIGHTGSGKSTLVQQMNALLKPSTGFIDVDGRQITADTSNKNLKVLRQHVGMVFQFPENQLFEETVKKDVMFGPLNFGMGEAKAEAQAIKLVKEVGLDSDILERSPFELSGGQMRRVAIAGVLASDPQTLILDEPTAGLDPRGRNEIMELVQKLHQEQGKTIILVTHQMEDVAKYADQVIVMDEGQVEKIGSPQEVFSNIEWLQKHHLELPQTTQFAISMQKKGFSFPDHLPLNEDELAIELAKQIDVEGSGELG
ncbi:energy-coupling factor ABC transporter ATP-binding protein [Secundilactobacillus malefermentans]|uniref:energy-coupling factor ABC transporter ATP-binding protein n=1 Tax=Secundilactobacillus malefermentans TaxID=176292 RepID=UPI0011C7F34E|nr:energy-coupling factor ABC transporter ATP-binding protein [Secundilactobacillus malefermentans]QEA30975.1 energy-coupling factor ABC transporter ATP-binding protein [Secundilactobacillus malefermentans]